MTGRFGNLIWVMGLLISVMYSLLTSYLSLDELHHVLLFSKLTFDKRKIWEPSQNWSWDALVLEVKEIKDLKRRKLYKDWKEEWVRKREQVLHVVPRKDTSTTCPPVVLEVAWRQMDPTELRWHRNPKNQWYWNMVAEIDKLFVKLNALIKKWSSCTYAS